MNQPAVTLTAPPLNAGRSFLTLLGLIGFGLVVLNVLLILVFPVLLIGIPFTIMMAVGAAALVVIGRMTRFSCPNCGKRTFIMAGEDKFKCSRCEHLTLIDWKQ